MSSKKNFFKFRVEPPIPTANLELAYSFRRLELGYPGPCLRVKRDSDSTEQDINFLSNGEVDTASLLAFVGAGDGWLSRWHNQSDFTGSIYAYPIGGNGYKIVESGVIPTLNGKMTAVPDGGYYNIGQETPQTDWAILWVGKYDGGSQLYRPGSSGRTLFRNNGTTLSFRLDGTTATFAVSVSTTTQTISAASYDVGTDIKLIYEGTDYGVQPMATVRNVNSILGGTSQMQELIMYTGPQRTEFVTINTSINDYYNSY